MSDETRPDPKGCPNCGRIDCGDFLADEYPRCDGLGIPPMRVDWQSYAARLFEEQRAKAMEAAARVAHLSGTGMPKEAARGLVERLAKGAAPLGRVHVVAIEVLRAFEIVK